MERMCTDRAKASQSSMHSSHDVSSRPDMHKTAGKVDTAAIVNMLPREKAPIEMRDEVVTCVCNLLTLLKISVRELKEIIPETIPTQQALSGENKSLLDLIVEVYNKTQAVVLTAQEIVQLSKEILKVNSTKAPKTAIPKLNEFIEGLKSLMTEDLKEVLSPLAIRNLEVLIKHLEWLSKWKEKVGPKLCLQAFIECQSKIEEVYGILKKDQASELVKVVTANSASRPSVFAAPLPTIPKPTPTPLHSRVRPRPPALLLDSPPSSPTSTQPRPRILTTTLPAHPDLSPVSSEVETEHTISRDHSQVRVEVETAHPASPDRAQVRVEVEAMPQPAKGRPRRTKVQNSSPVVGSTSSGKRSIAAVPTPASLPTSSWKRIRKFCWEDRSVCLRVLVVICSIATCFLLPLAIWLAAKAYDCCCWNGKGVQHIRA